MRGNGYSFESGLDEMFGDQLRALDPSVDPTEFDIELEGVSFDEDLGMFRLEDDEGKTFQESHAGKTHEKRYNGRKIALQKRNRDSEILPLEVDYLKDELLEFRIAFMNLVSQQESSQTELEGHEKGFLSAEAKKLILVNQKFVEVTLRKQISDTLIRKEDALRLQKEIGDSKESSKIVDWMMTGKRYKEDISHSPFHMLSNYEGSLYYSSLTDR